MSTIKSSAEDLTLNADGSNEVKFQINAVEKASINSSGLFTSTTIDATALTGNLPAISGASLTGITTGKVLQVLSATKTDTSTVATTTWTDVGSLSVAITPSATSSKILVTVAGCGNGGPGVDWAPIRLVRDSTAIAIGDSATSRTQVSTSMYDNDSGNLVTFAINYLDSPSTTSATTYKVQWRHLSTGTMYFNRSSGDTTNAMRGTSTITVMEIGA